MTWPGSFRKQETTHVRLLTVLGLTVLTLAVTILLPPVADSQLAGGAAITIVILGLSWLIGWSGQIFKANPQGCPVCNGNGYKGREGIHELMVNCEALTEGKKTGVRSVEFIGNVAYSSYRLKDIIKTHESNLLSFLGGGDVYDPDRVEADRDLIRRFYLKHGFADVQVVAALTEYDPQQKGFLVTFKIEEGQQYRVAAVNFESSIPTLDANSQSARKRAFSWIGDRHSSDANSRQRIRSRSRSRLNAPPSLPPANQPRRKRKPLRESRPGPRPSPRPAQGKLRPKL